MAYPSPALIEVLRRVQGPGKTYAKDFKPIDEKTHEMLVEAISKVHPDVLTCIEYVMTHEGKRKGIMEIDFQFTTCAIIMVHALKDGKSREESIQRAVDCLSLKSFTDLFIHYGVHDSYEELHSYTYTSSSYYVSAIELHDQISLQHGDTQWGSGLPTSIADVEKFLTYVRGLISYTYINVLRKAIHETNLPLDHKDYEFIMWAGSQDDIRFIAEMAFERSTTDIGFLREAIAIRAESSALLSGSL